LRTSRTATTRGVRAAAAATALALLAAGCGGGDTAGNASGKCDEPFRICLMLGLAGVYAAVAESQKKALDCTPSS
jgi:hypothetical protein